MKLETLAQAQEIVQEKEAKCFDLPVNMDEIEIKANFPGQNIFLKVHSSDGNVFGTTSLAQTQICTKLGVPSSYLQKCPTHLAQQNLDYWKAVRKSDIWVLKCVRDFQGEKEKRYIRGVVSHSYVEIMNTDLIEAVSEIRVPMRPGRFNLSDEIFYLHMTSQEPLIDDYYLGLVITNSEVGISSLRISEAIHRKQCTNDLLLSGYGYTLGMQQRHIGKFSNIAGRIHEIVSAWNRKYSIPGYREIYSSHIKKAKEDMLDSKTYNGLMKAIGFTESLSREIAQITKLDRGEKASRLSVIDAITNLSQKRDPLDGIEIDRLAGKLLICRN